MHRFSITQEKNKIFFIFPTNLIGEYAVYHLILLQTELLNKFIFAP